MLRSLCEGDDGFSGIKKEMLNDVPYCSRYVRRPKIPGLVDINGDAQWEIRGRVICPRGGLPRTLFPQLSDEAQGKFLHEIFFNITPEYGPSMMGDEVEGGYHVEMSPIPLWAEWDYIKHSIQKDEDPGFTSAEAEDERLPPIRSHARGLISVKEMDRIDGLSPPVPAKTEVILWRATRHQAEKRPLVPSALNIMEDDCLEGLYEFVGREASKLASLPLLPTPSHPRLPWQANSQDSLVKNTEVDTSITENDKEQEKTPKKKKSLRSRIMSAARRILLITGRRLLKR